MVTISNDPHTIEVQRWSKSRQLAHGVGMGETEHDLDVIDFCHWMRNLRGLSDATIRVRLDVLLRLATHIGVPLRNAEPGHLLSFERTHIAGRAPETRRSYACHIRSFYRWAKAAGIVTEDPSLMLTLPKVPKHLPRPIEEEDLALALKKARVKMAAMLTLGAYAGLRCIEMAGLDWSDVRREQDGSIYLHVRHGKGSKERTVGIGETVMAALRAYGMKRRGPMFLGQEGRPMTAETISRVINQHLQRHGIEASAHQLRHRYATVSYELTHDLRLVQEQLGHESPQTTASYTRMSGKQSAKLVAALDALALPSPRVAGPAPAGHAGSLNLN